MILKIEHDKGYYVNREFLSFKTTKNNVEVVSFSAHTDNPIDIVKSWKAVYILNQKGETIDTIRK